MTVDVRLGDYGDRLAGYSATTSADGAFMIEGLAPGRSHARAAKAGVGKVSAAVDLVAGETAECELTLERGLVIKGRVLGPDGSPLVGVHRVQLVLATSSPYSSVRRDLRLTVCSQSC